MTVLKYKSVLQSLTSINFCKQKLYLYQIISLSNVWIYNVNSILSKNVNFQLCLHQYLFIELVFLGNLFVRIQKPDNKFCKSWFVKCITNNLFYLIWNAKCQNLIGWFKFPLKNEVKIFTSDFMLCALECYHKYLVWKIERLKLGLIVSRR